MSFSTFRNRVRCVSRAFAITGLISSGAWATAETLDGFVTKVESPTDFYLSALRVEMGENTQCATEIRAASLRRCRSSASCSRIHASSVSSSSL